MSYVYQWIGVVNAWAFVTGCMIGVASLAARQQGFAPMPVPVSQRKPSDRAGADAG